MGPTFRVVIHVDLDYFYAQVEEREHPEYRERPVVVCVYSRRTDESGAVSTANYVARRFGVRSGISIFLAKRLLKDEDAIFVPTNYPLYSHVSNRIMDQLRTFGDKFEQVSVDEVYLDVSEQTKSDFAVAEKLGVQLKELIYAKEELTCSVGIGLNKVVAKIAANQHKPNGLTVVTPDRTNEFLWGLPVRRLHGIGRKTEKILADRGVTSIGELSKYPVEELVDVFGWNLGNYFHLAANGIDESPVQEREEVKSISRITTLKQDTSDAVAIIKVLRELSADLLSTGKSKGLEFRTVSLVVITNNMSTFTRSLTLDSPTDQMDILVKTVRQLVETFSAETKLTARRVGVRISNLTPLSTQRTLKSYLG